MSECCVLCVPCVYCVHTGRRRFGFVFAGLLRMKTESQTNEKQPTTTNTNERTKTNKQQKNANKRMNINNNKQAHRFVCCRSLALAVLAVLFAVGELLFVEAFEGPLGGLTRDDSNMSRQHQTKRTRNGKRRRSSSHLGAALSTCHVWPPAN